MKDVTDNVLKNVIKPRKQETHKYNYGNVLLIGGNKNYGGAIIMSAQAAVNSGAGLVTVASDPINMTSIHSVVPEAIFQDYTDGNNLKNLIKKMNVVTIGTGLGNEEQSLKILKLVFQTIKTDQALIIDGSAFSLIDEHNLKLPNSKVILTPHQGEWERISGIQIKDQTVDNNEKFLKTLSENKVVLVLKKHRTEIYYRDHVWRNTSGNASMATAGMGDTLAGMISGFCAQFQDMEASICAAVYLHGLIGDKLSKEQYVTTPSKISQLIPSEMKFYSEN
ncbi:NAD(P)H-hydrate dehydratase [Xylocopilactobacillus apis]|uniref:ADP-dependent (S)-NAD(P)H-hydrate dehydratase n=1 Tax=Xylocopilactobacillus apis TaxID=2932183 RepID=A0AAU9CYV8_9LACO|nr:NAD(P)H-hydrate dehydratase [Xylocopilactobacillus apis]BDR56413.1 ADP-dependent (S)-NAD(P)H-hydrate dehydratase [Xylocopilactobacillus apis]